MMVVLGGLAHLLFGPVGVGVLVAIVSLCLHGE